MRLGLALIVLVGLSASASAEGFDLVIPGRPGVPIIIDGMDVSYAVLEGDFGLGKGVNNHPTIYGGRLAEPVPNVGHYYPSLGVKPGYGRLEIEPPANRKLPQPAESYHDSVHAESAPLPPTMPNVNNTDIPFYPPPVIVAPGGGDNHWRPGFPGPSPRGRP